MTSLPSWFTDVAAAMELGEPQLDDKRVRNFFAAVQSRAQGNDLDLLLGGFLAGYATGMAEGSQQADFDRAHRAALAFLTQQLRLHTES